MSGTEFPPAPWRLRGRMWAALFPTDAPVPLPADLHSVIGDRRLAVLLVRYERGTLRYDELALGVPVRRGLRAGLWVDAMWVSDAAALWGGRRIWGMPKQIARFNWDDGGGGVRIEAAAGPIAAFSLGGNATGVPVPWLPAPFFGRREEEGGSAATRIFTFAHLRGARLARGGIRRVAWSARLPYGAGERPLLGVTIPAFHFIVPPPVDLA